MAAPIQNPAKCEVRSVIRFPAAKGEREVLGHLPYSPYLAPSDFHLFLYLKRHLAGQHFDDDDEIKNEVEIWFKQQAVDFYDTGIQKLVPRLNKCLDNGGNYVEK